MPSPPGVIPSLAEAAPEADDVTQAPKELARLRTAALLPDLLQDGELIILRIKPSPWYIVLEALRFIIAATFVLVVGLLLQIKGYLLVSRIDLFLLALVAMGVRLLWQFLEWLSRVYVLTDLRVIVIGGVLRVLIFQAQLKKIQHTVTLFSLRERLIGLGTIGFATAGTGSIEAVWRMIANPLEVHQTVIQTLNRYK